MPSTRAASKLFTLPPKTGQSFTAAFSMPGNFTSMPYSMVPLTFFAVSRRFSGLPAIFQVLGSFSGTSFGCSRRAAASATLP